MQTDDAVPFPQVVARRAGESPDRPYLVEVDGRSLSYAEAHDEALAWAARLQQLGVTAGDTVAVLLPTSATAVSVWLGLGWLGAIEVPVNTSLKARLLHHVLEGSRARVLVTCDRFAPQLAEVLAEVAAIDTVVTIDGFPPVAGGATVVDVATVRAPSASGELAGPADHDIATILYTSGTTGPSKGVMVPWAQLHASATQSMPSEDLHEGDVFYTPFALFHVTGKSACYSSALFGGAVVLHEQFKTDRYWADIERYGCTTTVLMGAMAQFLFRQPALERDAETPLRNVLMAPLIPEVDAFASRFGVRVCTVFNMTEVSSPIRSDGWTLADERSCGRPRPGWECRIVDEWDRDVPVGHTGELVVRASEPWTMMAGYWQMPEKTAEACRNLWFHTGDALRRDDAGNFYFVDRLKDAIRRRGENISSLEVEREVCDHPAVLEAAAFGVPSEWGEEEVMVVVVPRGDHELDPQGLVEFLGDRLPSFMVPRYVELAEDLPRTPTEKVRKGVLRERGVGPTTWDRAHAKDPVR